MASAEAIAPPPGFVDDIAPPPGFVDDDPPVPEGFIEDSVSASSESASIVEDAAESELPESTQPKQHPDRAEEIKSGGGILDSDIQQFIEGIPKIPPGAISSPESSSEDVSKWLVPANVNALSPSVVQAESDAALTHEYIKEVAPIYKATLEVPLVEIPKPENTGVGSGITRGLASTAESLVTLENMGIMTAVAKAPKLLQQLTSAGFGAHMIAGAVEQFEEAEKGATPGERAEGRTKAVMSLLLGGLAAKHATGRAPIGAAERAASMGGAKLAVEQAKILQPVAGEAVAGKTAPAGATQTAATPATAAIESAAELLPSALPEATKPGEAASTKLAEPPPEPQPPKSTTTPSGGSASSGKSWKQSALPEELRTSTELESILSGAKEEPTGAGMTKKDFSTGGALGGGGGGKPIVNPKGTTPKGDTAFIRIETAPKRIGKGLFTEGAADVMAKSENKVGQVLAKQMKKHVDVEQEINGQLVSELDRAMKGMSKERTKSAIAELEPYLAAKENRRPLPPISKEAQSILTAWENIAERTGLMSEAHDVQVFDPTTGSHRPMHRMGRAYVPRVFKQEVQQVLSDPRTNPKLFNDLANELATHRGITPEAAATELRGVAGRFQSSDFMGNMEMARTGQLPEIFYDYNLGNIASRYIPSFSERMAQIIAYGQRLGPREAPLRENLWDVAMKEAEDGYTQQWIRSAEDQSANLRAAGGPLKVAQQGQTLASGLLLSSPTTSVIRNMLSGLTATTELLGVRRSVENLVKAATDAQTKLDAREIGAVRENLGDFLHADQLGTSKGDALIRGTVNATLKYSGYNGSEGFVRTHAASTASQFARDGIAAIAKNPASMASKEALGLFKRMGVDAEKIVAEGADWKTGAETRKFVRTVIRESQGGYRFDQVPLWANSAVGRFFYQFGRYGVQRARNIWKNGIMPLVGEEVQWHGKTMARRDARPILKMGIGAVVLGETFALVAQGFFGRDRKDASIQEITEALKTDQKQAALLAGERIINDIIMSGTLGIFGQPLDFAKSLKDQSRFKNPAEPPAMSSTKALVKFAQDTLDQEGRVTNKDVLSLLGGIVPGVKQLSDVARNAFDEPLYEAENDVRTLRTAATRWAAANKLDVPKKMVGDFRKSAKAPEYGEIYEALLVGDSSRAKVLAEKFAVGSGDKVKATSALKSSIKGRQPFRVGPFTNGEFKTEFMTWAAKSLPKKDYEQARRVQDRYEAAAKAAGLW